MVRKRYYFDLNRYYKAFGNTEEDVRKWGSKKKYYYGGHTGEELEHEHGDSGQGHSLDRGWSLA